MLRHLSLIPNEILFTSRVLEKHLHRDDYLETYRYLDTYLVTIKSAKLSVVTESNE